MRKQRRQFATGNLFDEDKNEFTFEPQKQVSIPPPSIPPQLVSKSNKDEMWMINYQITVVNESEVPKKPITIPSQLPQEPLPTYQTQPQKRFQREEVFGVSPLEQQSQTELYANVLGINQCDLLDKAKISNNSEQFPDQVNIQREEETSMKAQFNHYELPQKKMPENQPTITNTNPFQSPQLDKNQQVKEDAMTRTQKLLQQSQQLLQKSRQAQSIIKEPSQQTSPQQPLQQPSTFTPQQRFQQPQFEIQKPQQQIIQPPEIQILQPVQKQSSSPISNDIQSIQTSQSPSTTQLSSPPQAQQVLSPPPVRIPSIKTAQSASLIQQQTQTCPKTVSPQVNEQQMTPPELKKESKSTENDFEFQFILKALSKQQRLDHIQTLLRQWQHIQQKSQEDQLLLLFSDIIQRLLFNLGSAFLDGNMQDSQKNLLNLLNNMIDTEFQSSYSEIFEKNHNSWETILLINLGYTQDEIRIDNQEIILKYLKNRSYQNDKEVLVMLLASLIKMEQSDLKQKEFQMIYTALSSESQPYSSFFLNILWLSLKMFPRFMNKKNFKSLFDLFLNNQIYADSPHYFISLMILSSLSDQFPINQLITHANTFNNLGFLESLAIRFDVQLPGEFYYQVAQHCVQKQKPKIALEFLKVALELGYSQAKELRDQLINQVYQQKDVSQPQQGGFFDSFKQVIQKTIAQPIKPKQEEKEPRFYYDPNLKTWIIDGKVAENEEQPGGNPKSQNSSETSVTQPPPQKNIPPPPQLAPRLSQPQSPVYDQLNPIAKPTSLQANPFSSPELQSNVDQKLKRNRLMGNRYVQ